MSQINKTIEEVLNELIGVSYSIEAVENGNSIYYYKQAASLIHEMVQERIYSDKKILEYVRSEVASDNTIITYAINYFYKDGSVITTNNKNKNIYTGETIYSEAQQYVIKRYFTGKNLFFPTTRLSFDRDFIAAVTKYNLSHPTGQNTITTITNLSRSTRQNISNICGELNLFNISNTRGVNHAS